MAAGVLGAGSAYKARTTFATEYGLIVLVVPVAWITAAMIRQHRLGETDDWPEVITAASGILVLRVLLVGVFQAAALPWVRLFSCTT